MSPYGDYLHEMNAPCQLDDATAEALLTGRAVDDELAPLVHALRAYRDLARESVRPSDELATLMAAGAFADPSSAPRRSSWRRFRMAVTGTRATVVAKVTGMGVAAQTAVVLSIAAAGVATAGVGGVLPGPVQERFDQVVGSVAPARSPDPAPDENADFGQRVGEDARDGGVDGGEISEDARQQGNRQQDDRHRPSDLPTPAGGRPSDLPTGASRPSDLPTPASDGRPTDLPTPADGGGQPSDLPTPTDTPKGGPPDG